MESCKICNSNSEEIFVAKVLGKHNVKYYKCSNCSFIQTESPHWLEEAYSEAIAETDVGLVSRNVEYRPILYNTIHKFFDPKKSFIDYGGGYGIFVRMMRDLGLDFYRYDTYCENIFCKGFDIEDSGKNKFELLTAFEVFEHLVEPVKEVEKMLALSENILLTTQLQPDEIIHPNDWWYFTFETGQHVSLFSKESLQILADRYGLKLISNGNNLHLLTKQSINNSYFKWITKSRISKVFFLKSRLFSKKSLLQNDYQKVKERLHEGFV